MNANSTSLIVRPTGSFDARSGSSSAHNAYVGGTSASTSNRQARRRQNQIDRGNQTISKAQQRRDKPELGITEFATQLIKDLCETLPEPMSADERFHADTSGYIDAALAVAPPSWFDPVSSAWTWVASGVESALSTLVWPRPVGAQATCSVDGRCTNTVPLSQRRQVSDLVSEAKAAGWIVEMSPKMKERLALDPHCSLVDVLVMIPNHQHLLPQVNQKTMQLIRSYFVAGDPSKDAPGDIVAVELEQQCETAQGMKLFGDACVSIDDAELRNMIDEKYYKPAVTSARQFLAEAERANSQLKAEFSAWRQRMGDSDSLAIDMARDYAQQLAKQIPQGAWPKSMTELLKRSDALLAKLEEVNAAREKTMARKRRRLIKPGRTYFESTGWLHAEAQRKALFKNYPVIYLSEPSAWENPATKKRPVDPV